MHAHALLKVDERPHRIDADVTRAVDVGDRSPGFDVVEVERTVRETWQRTTGAYVVEVAALVSPGAALGYLGLHHRKPSQAPPSVWRGMTERASQRYWSRPIAELRKQARAELAVEAHAWRTGMTLEVAALELAARPTARLVRTRRSFSFAQLRESLGEVVR